METGENGLLSVYAAKPVEEEKSLKSVHAITHHLLMMVWTACCQGKMKKEERKKRLL